MLNNSTTLDNLYCADVPLRNCSLTHVKQAFTLSLSWGISKMGSAEASFFDRLADWDEVMDDTATFHISATLDNTYSSNNNNNNKTSLKKFRDTQKRLKKPFYCENTRKTFWCLWLKRRPCIPITFCVVTRPYSFFVHWPPLRWPNGRLDPILIYIACQVL